MYSVRSSTFRHRGFSLIEAAIVLGLIGIVIGGIWVATASVRQKMQADRMISVTLELSANMNKLFKGMTVPYANVTSEMIDAGVVPKDFQRVSGEDICWSGGDYAAKSPYGKDTLVCLAGTFSGSGYYIEIMNMSEAECISFISRFQSHVHPSNGPDYFELSDAHSPSWGNLPMTLSEIQEECYWSGNSTRIHFTQP